MAKTQYCSASGNLADMKGVWSYGKTTTGEPGWRAHCPVCSKEVAVTPHGKRIQKHTLSNFQSRGNLGRKAKKPAKKQRLTVDRAYELQYEKGLNGKMSRPSKMYSEKLCAAWIMGYIDGLSDGNHPRLLKIFAKFLFNDPFGKQFAAKAKFDAFPYL